MGNVVSFSKGIDRLSQENIIRLDDPVDDGIRACTRPCFIRWGDGSESQAYIKVFNAGLNTCVVNELTGFFIGRACNLPLPKKIGLLQLPESIVIESQCCESSREPHQPNHSLSTWLGNIVNHEYKDRG